MGARPPAPRRPRGRCCLARYPDKFYLRGDDVLPASEAPYDEDEAEPPRPDAKPGPYPYEKEDWRAVGVTSQLAANLVVKLGRPARYTLIPMLFITSMALAAAVSQLRTLYEEGGITYFLLWIDAVIVVLAILVLLEAGSAFFRARRAAETGATA